LTEYAVDAKSQDKEKVIDAHGVRINQIQVIKKAVISAYKTAPYSIRDDALILFGG